MSAQRKVARPHAAPAEVLANSNRAAVPPPAGSCDSSSRDSVCFRDTAYVHEDTSANPSANAQWLWFAAPGDSIEIRVRADSRSHHAEPSIVMTLGVDEQGATTNGLLRRRLNAAGVVVAWVVFYDYVVGDVMPGDTVGYELRIRRIGDQLPATLRATGRSAKLTLQYTRGSRRFTIAPLAAIDAVSDSTHWTLFDGTYNVALVGDSLYRICLVPCSAPDTITLRPGAVLTWRR